MPILNRASTDTSSDFTSATGTISEIPFFPTSVVAPPPTQNQKDANAKAILEWVLLVVVLVFLAGGVLCRCRRLRRGNRNSNQFLLSPPNPRPLHNHRTNPRSLSFAEHPQLPSAYIPYATYNPYPLRRIHGADIDSGGRRLDSGAGSADKDALPAYDNIGGPPKYGESEMLAMHNRLAGDGQGDNVGTFNPHGAPVPSYNVDRSEISSDPHRPSDL